MSFEIETPVDETPVDNTPAAAPTTDSSVNISKENIIYRTYGLLDENGVPSDEKGKKPVVRRQSADGKVWEELEKAGLIRLVENTYVWYTLLNEEGFADLVTDPDQRLAIINKGINALQTATANQTQVDFDKESGQFVTNDQTVDLIEAINEPVSKRGQNPLQKALGNVKTLSAADKAAFMAALLKMMEG